MLYDIVALGSQDMRVWGERSYVAHGRKCSQGAVADPRAEGLDCRDQGAVSKPPRPRAYRKRACAMGGASWRQARTIPHGSPHLTEVGVYDPHHACF
jgi:hypothetical protein